jgi:hypothetical protein
MDPSPVIPGRREAANSESILTNFTILGWQGQFSVSGIMDSGPAGFARVPE